MCDEQVLTNKQVQFATHGVYIDEVQQNIMIIKYILTNLLEGKVEITWIIMITVQYFTSKNVQYITLFMLSCESSCFDVILQINKQATYVLMLTQDFDTFRFIGYNVLSINNDTTYVTLTLKDREVLNKMC